MRPLKDFRFGGWMLIVVLIFTTNANLLAGLAIPDIVAKTKPAVALVKTWDSKGNLLGSGTGFLISEDGRLVTNLHVIKDAATVTIELPNGGAFACEGVLAESPGVDLAILKVKGSGLPEVEAVPRSQRAKRSSLLAIQKAFNGPFPTGLMPR
jgi:S1-C subfamily serine protease